MSELPIVFAALGDATRFAIVEKLMSEGELAVGDLLDVGDMSPPAISRHLKVLRNAGIVERRVDQQRRLYSINARTVQSIEDWTLHYREFWQQGLDRLEKLLAQEKDEK